MRASLDSWSQVTLQLQADALHLASDLIERFPAIVIAIVVIVVTRFVAKGARRSATAVGRRALRSSSLQVLAEKPRPSSCGSAAC